MSNIDLPNLNIVLGIIVAIFIIVARLTGWGKTILTKIKNLFITYRPEVPRETLRIYPVLSRTWWHMGSLNKKAAMQITGHFRITNITERNVRVVGTRIIKPRKARKEGTVIVQHSEQNIYGHYPISPHATTEASVDFWLQPPVCEYGQDFKATLVLIDQYTNEHKTKELVFRGDRPKETKKQERPKEAVHTLADPIEKQVVSVLKAEVDRYKGCGRGVGGLGSIQTTYKGQTWTGVGTRWKEADSPKNQAVAMDPDNAIIESDNARALLNLCICSA